ncbi:MAG TPA: heparinase II/III family protein [Gemmatimonadales bacterium]|nr:heparinase II/III family protein [Gemmatimonadales bacterium]
MLSGQALAERRDQVRQSADLARLLARLSERARPVLERDPIVPPVKALLSSDGGICPRDGSGLLFDPWSPDAHRCPRCGERANGERHHRWWARFQHLWLAERAAHLAAVAAFNGDARAARRAAELLAAYGELYPTYPNSDNVLGPSRPFFSTYLESIWITNLVAAALLLRETNALDDSAGRAMDLIGDESAALIGEFNEGFSNRQTWHNAALAALAVWFEDEELLSGALSGPAGLLAHALQGFAPDGMWYEGENYHLFALRGLLVGLDFVRAADVDPREEVEVSDRVQAALLAPALTALPDGTFPARKDARFGVSLAQPMYLELWEAGRSGDRPGGGLEDWLASLYARPAPPAESFDSYLHESGEPPPRERHRSDLSWWMLLSMPPSIAGEAARWQPPTVFLESQGLAVLRTGGRYVSVESGIHGGGHGHPDRLHLTLHDGGVHWLPDPGTGSYVARDLFWYRSTLAHNAPRVDGRSQPPGDAVAEFFAVAGDWSWVQGRYGDVRRTVVSGPEYLLDVVDLSGDEERLLEVPWHLAGEITVTTPGRWERALLEDEFVTAVERFVPETESPLAVRARVADQQLSLTLAGGELLRATAPGTPGAPPTRFLLCRSRVVPARLVAVLSARDAAEPVRVTADHIEIGTGDQHRQIVDGWQIDGPPGTVRLAGRRVPTTVFEPLVTKQRPYVQEGVARWVDVPPATDGTLDGFDLSEPLTLDHEDQYRRSEEPYPGAEELSATAWANWDDEALYLAVEIVKPELVLRPGDAPPLRLDNEPDDIHSDGLQVYVALPDGGVFAALIVPDEGDARLRVRPVRGAEPADITGDWTLTQSGYLITLAIRLPDWSLRRRGDTLPFDLIVNEMRTGRERRAGQLVWSGRGGWVWLRGDRQPPANFGTLALA